LLKLRGDEGARVLFRDLADQILEVEMPDDAVLVDIDTEAALDAVRTRFAQAEATRSDPPQTSASRSAW
jgi:CTP:molybdopterin cytidylyltransferase MocA